MFKMPNCNNNAPINILLSNFKVTALVINNRPIKIKDTAKLILKNGKLIMMVLIGTTLKEAYH